HDRARGQLALPDRGLVLAAATVPELRTARADATPAFGPDLTGQQLALLDRRRRWRWRGWRLATSLPALSVAEAGSLRADTAAGVVHHEALRALLHLVGDGEGMARVRLRAGPT